MAHSSLRQQVSPLGPSGTALLRRITAGDGTSCLVKRMPAQELGVHCLVAGSMGLSPAILSAWPAEHASFDVTMPEVRRGTAGARQTMSAALAALAVVHRRFRGARTELRGLGLGPAIDAGLGATSLIELLEAPALGLAGAVASEALGRWRRIERALPGLVEQLLDEAHWTLVHGDLHQDNVILDVEDRVWLLDWGSAALGPPTWDLAFCAEELVLSYLGAAGFDGSYGLFLTRLRQACIVRLFSTALELAGPIGAGLLDARQRQVAITACLERADAARHRIGL